MHLWNMKKSIKVPFTELYVQKLTVYGMKEKHVLFDIDVVGGLNVKAQYPLNTLSIFVQPPSLDELESRLRKRGTETEDKIQQRLDKSAKELVYAQDFDVILVNDELNKAKQEVVRVVKQHLQS